MTPPSVVGILREPIFSPGMVEHDAAILSAVSGELRARHGIECPVVPIEELADIAALPRLILSMADGDDALDVLGVLERAGAVVLNSPAAVRATRRANLLALARPHGPLVEGAVVETDDGDRIPASFLANGAIWVKRADFHALGPGDVVRVTADDAIAALRTMRTRGIARAVVQPHVEGRMMKFYAVAPVGDDGAFFQTFPADGGLSPEPEVVARLRAGAFEAARRAGLVVFGGDAVIGGSEPVIVDLNAWPSFWRCRAAAARAIATRAVASLLSGRTRERA